MYAGDATKIAEVCNGTKGTTLNTVMLQPAGCAWKATCLKIPNPDNIRTNKKGSNGSGVIDFDAGNEHCAAIVASLEEADKAWCSTKPLVNRSDMGTISTWVCLEDTATIQDLTKLSAQELEDGLAKDVEPQMLGTLGPATPWWSLKHLLEHSAAVQMMVRLFPWDIEKENKKGLKIYVEGIKLFGEGVYAPDKLLGAQQSARNPKLCDIMSADNFEMLRSSADINTHGALHPRGECTMISCNLTETMASSVEIKELQPYPSNDAESDEDEEDDYGTGSETVKKNIDKFVQHVLLHGKDTKTPTQYNGTVGAFTRMAPLRDGVVFAVPIKGASYYNDTEISSGGEDTRPESKEKFKVFENDETFATLTACQRAAVALYASTVCLLTETQYDKAVKVTEDAIWAEIKAECGDDNAKVKAAVWGEEMHRRALDFVPFDDAGNSDGLPSEAIGKTMRELFKMCAGNMSLYGENEKLYGNARDEYRLLRYVTVLMVHATTEARKTNYIGTASVLRVNPVVSINKDSKNQSATLIVNPATQYKDMRTTQVTADNGYQLKQNFAFTGTTQSDELPPCAMSVAVLGFSVKFSKMLTGTDFEWKPKKASKITEGKHAFGVPPDPTMPTVTAKPELIAAVLCPRDGTGSGGFGGSKKQRVGAHDFFGAAQW